MKKGKNVKKNKKIKKIYAKKLGYCPYSSFGSRYNGLHRDRHGWGVQQGGHDTAKRPCDTARKGHDTAGPCVGACGSTHAHAAWLARESQYKNCIVARGGFYVAIWL